VKSNISLTVEYAQELTESSQSNQPNRTPLYFCRHKETPNNASILFKTVNLINASSCDPSIVLPKIGIWVTRQQPPARIFLVHIGIGLNLAGKLSLETFCIIREEIWESVSASAFPVDAAALCPSISSGGAVREYVT
jgi:hypothetical protein